MQQSSNRVLVGLSGGLDSAVTAAILKTQGYDVIGLYLHLKPHPDYKVPLNKDLAPNAIQGGAHKTSNIEPDLINGCKSGQNIEKAKEVSKKLGITLHEIQVFDLFEYEVLDFIVQEGLHGRFPLPCTRCHVNVKIKSLFKKADELGCQWVATGHYVKIIRSLDGGESNLLAPVDSKHDQSYFLYNLQQKELSRLLTPLGDLLKNNIKKMAATFNLITDEELMSKEEERCTHSDEGITELIFQRTVDRNRFPGPIMNREGFVLGRHQGIYKFRIGQRGGVGFEGNPDYKDHSVMGFDLKNNGIVVGNEEDHMHKGCLVTDCNWLGLQDFSKGLLVSAKLESVSDKIPAIITLLNPSNVIVEFIKPYKGVIPGNPIVFYQDDLAIGGGLIEDFIEPLISAKKHKPTPKI